MRFFACLLTLTLSLAALPLQAQEPARPKDPKEQAPPPQARPARVHPGRALRAPGQSPDRAGGRRRRLPDRAALRPFRVRYGRSSPEPGRRSLGKKDFPLAVELIDRVLALQPNWAEAWYKRATVFYQLDDPVAAMADLHRALKIEPRHFNAWTGLGHILMASDDKARALQAYRRVLKINPQMSDVKTIVDRLSPEVDGQDL